MASFIQGLFAQKKTATDAPFVICRLSAKREELIQYLQQLKDEWVNMKVLESKKDPSKLYVELNNWKPGDTNKVYPPAQPTEDINQIPSGWVDDGSMNPDDIPF